MKIFIDPGHGGVDSGACGPSGVMEKQVNLAVGALLGDLCRSGGHSVKLSREGDYFIDLSPRAEMANSWGADIYVSIHCNSSTPAARGTETFSFPGSSRGAELARRMQTALTQTLGTEDRGVKTANFAVLRRSAMPAVLVELAFLTNPAEEKLLSDPAVHKKCAAALYTALTGQDTQPPESDMTTGQAVKIIQEHVEGADEWCRYILSRDYGDAFLVKWAKSYQGVNIHKF